MDLAVIEVPSEEILGLRIGDIPAVELRAEGRAAVSALVQGAPEAGPAEVVISTLDGDVSIGEAFTYLPARDPLFDRVVAIGASLTQGVQGGVPSYHGSLMSPAAQVARQLGGWFPLPLLEPGLFPRISAEQVGPPPACATPDVTGFVTASATDIVPALWDDEAGTFGFYTVRLDPDRVPANLAVGGSDLADVVHGLPPGDFGLNFVAHLVYDPWGPFGSDVAATQLDLLETLEPTLVLSTDLFGNDLIGALLEADTIEPGLLTDEASFVGDLDELLERIAATGAHAVLATLPRPSLLPATEAKRSAMIEDGLATEAEANAAIAEVDARAARFNALLLERAASRPGLSVVDLAAETERLEQTGLAAGRDVLTVDRFGGLLGLDGVHFTDTGYGMVANLFLDELEDLAGVALPRIDLGPIAEADPDSPSALDAAGIDTEACD